MPSPRAQRNVSSSKGRLTEKSSSFHGRAAASASAETLRRPRTVPELSLPRNGVVEKEAARPMKLTKVLLNVTVQGSVGPVQVLMNPEASVRDLILASLKQYNKEGRRPVIGSPRAGGGAGDEFDLHYSQFSLESLDREEKIAALGSRNFFMCKRKAVVVATGEGGGGVTTSSSSCSKEAEKAVKLGPGGSLWPWLKFMNFLL